MENKLLKYILVLSLFLQIKTSFGQGNPGFIGKKIAIGYSGQFCLLRSDYIIDPGENASLVQVLTNHDFNIEYATNKYKSISFNLGYQKIPVNQYGGYGYGSDVVQTINFNTGPEEVQFERRGVSDFRMLAIGLKFTSYLKNKTICSPIGLGHYFRVDAYFNKALNNYYKYNVYEYSFSETKKAQAVKQLNKDFSNSNSTNFSIGYGVESKYPITQSVYFKFNGEFNVTLNVLKENTIGQTEENLTVEKDLQNIGKSIPDYRNMFLLGIGVGMLL